jgi:hypothetical protein
VTSNPDRFTEMYSKFQVLNFKTDDVFGMNTPLEGCMHTEMLRSLLTFNGDTKIHGLLCMLYTNTNQCFGLYGKTRATFFQTDVQQSR